MVARLCLSGNFESHEQYLRVYISPVAYFTHRKDIPNTCVSKQREAVSRRLTITNCLTLLIPPQAPLFGSTVLDNAEAGIVHGHVLSAHVIDAVLRVFSTYWHDLPTDIGPSFPGALRVNPFLGRLGSTLPWSGSAISMNGALVVTMAPQELSRDAE